MLVIGCRGLIAGLGEKDRRFGPEKQGQMEHCLEQDSASKSDLHAETFPRKWKLNSKNHF